MNEGPEDVTLNQPNIFEDVYNKFCDIDYNSNIASVKLSSSVYATVMPDVVTKDNVQLTGPAKPNDYNNLSYSIQLSSHIRQPLAILRAVPRSVEVPVNHSPRLIRNHCTPSYPASNPEGPLRRPGCRRQNNPVGLQQILSLAPNLDVNVNKSQSQEAEEQHQCL